MNEKMKNKSNVMFFGQGSEFEVTRNDTITLKLKGSEIKLTYAEAKILRMKLSLALGEELKG